MSSDFATDDDGNRDGECYHLLRKVLLLLFRTRAVLDPGIV